VISLASSCRRRRRDGARHDRACRRVAPGRLPRMDRPHERDNRPMLPNWPRLRRC